MNRCPGNKSKLSALVVVVLVLLSVLNVQAQAEGLTEPFDDPALPGWEHSPDVEVFDGVLRIAPGNFAIHPGGWGDFRLVTRVQKTGEGEFIIGYRSSGGGSYILVVGPNFLLSQREADGELIELASVGEVSIPHGEWFQVDIQVSGSEHLFFINEQLIFESFDPEPLPSGSVIFETLGPLTLEVDELMLGLEDARLPEESGEEPVEDEQGDKPVEAVPFNGDLTWVRTGGPLGGLGYDVRMHPENSEIMFVTDAFAGVFKSVDGGKTWRPSNNGITVRGGMSGDAIPIFCLAIDPNNPDTIWTGTQNVRGIFKSEDGGESWEMKVNGIVEKEGITFRGIAIDPTDSQIVYAAAEIASWTWAGQEVLGREFDRTKGVIYKSTDGGENWQVVWRGENLARYILIDPRDTDVLYVSTGIFDREAANSDHTTNTPGGEGVLKSTDGGQTWQRINNGITNLYVGTLFMHPEDPDILLAGTGNNAFPDGSGVFLTTDGGENWDKVLEEGVQSVEFAVSNPSIAYAGNPGFIFKSTDGGKNWQSTLQRSVTNVGWGAPGVEAGFPIDFQVDPVNPDRIFANNYGGGNFMSADGGISWVDASTGYTGAQVRSIAVSPTQPGTLYAAARSGIFGTYDGGGLWVGLNYPQASGLEWNAVAVDPDDAEHVLAANNWSGIIYESADGGQSWTLSDIPWTNMQGWRAIVFAPSDTDTVYAGAGAFGSAGVFDNRLPAAGVAVSRNGGTNWTSANDANTQNSQVTNLAVDPTDPLTVFAASPANGLFKTMDGGATWEKLTGLGQQAKPLSVAVHPTQPELILAGMEFGGLYRSEDAGESWTAVAAGLPPEAVITSIVFHPRGPDLVFFADGFSGVYQSVDSGRTWLVQNNGLRTRAVNALAFSADGLHLYAATEGEGVFRLDLNGQPPAAGSLPEFVRDSGIVGEADQPEPEKAPESQDQPDLVSPPQAADDGVRQNTGLILWLGAGVAVVLLLAALILVRRKSR